VATKKHSIATRLATKCLVIASFGIIFYRYMIGNEIFSITSGLVTKNFLSSSLQQLKKFHHQAYGDQICFIITSFMTTKTSPVSVTHKPTQGSSKIPLT
jgi:hypothetical protein